MTKVQLVEIKLSREDCI